jgi:preprotein translocase subunit YajC
MFSKIQLLTLTCCAVAVSIFFSLVCISAYLILADARTDLAGSVERAAALSVQVEMTTDMLQENSLLELQETRKATADLHDLLIHTDLSLNGRRGHPGLLRQASAVLDRAQAAIDTLNSAIAAQNSALLETQGDLRNNLKQMLTATEQLQGAIADGDKLITDPGIHATVVNLQAATADLDASIKQLDVMLQSGTATAKDIQAVADKLREQYTKAQNLYYAIARELLGIGSEAVQFWLRK